MLLSFGTKTLKQGPSWLDSIRKQEKEARLHTIDSPIKHHALLSLPSKFDGRKMWGNLITPAYDQGTCQACWAYACVAALSDRFNIQTIGQTQLKLSPATTILCSAGDYVNREAQQDWNLARAGEAGCNFGATLEHALTYLYIVGATSYDCTPDDKPIRTRGKKVLPPFNKREKLETLECDDLLGSNTDLCFDGRPARQWRISAFYFFPWENTEFYIRYDLYRWGSVPTTMVVTERFLDWCKSEAPGRGYIYKPRSEELSQVLGGHALVIVGWGWNSDGQYWIVKNSWGDKWGMNGYFFIERGTDALEIEHNCMGIVPDFFQNKYGFSKNNFNLSPSYVIPHFDPDSDLSHALLPGMTIQTMGAREIVDGDEDTEFISGISRTLNKLTGFTLANERQYPNLPLPLNHCELPNFETFVAGRDVSRTAFGRWLERKKNGFVHCYWVDALAITVILLGLLTFMRHPSCHWVPHTKYGARHKNH